MKPSTIHDVLSFWGGANLAADFFLFAGGIWVLRKGRWRTFESYTGIISRKCGPKVWNAAREPPHTPPVGLSVRTQRSAHDIPYVNHFASSFRYWSLQVPIPVYSLQGIEGGVRHAGATAPAAPPGCTWFQARFQRCAAGTVILPVNVCADVLDTHKAYVSWLYIDVPCLKTLVKQG